MEFGARYKTLATRLNACDKVRRYDKPGEREGDTLAHALLDLDASFSRYCLRLLPDLEKASSNEEIVDHLLSIGEEMRHILYHLRDPEFFKYLLPGENA